MSQIVFQDTLVNMVVRRIAEAIQPQKIFLFGSRAKGNAKTSSDVDILIIYDGPLQKTQVVRQVYDLFESPNFSMDVMVLTSNEMEEMKPVANTLAREVHENGILCYG